MPARRVSGLRPALPFAAAATRRGARLAPRTMWRAHPRDPAASASEGIHPRAARAEGEPRRTGLPAHPLSHLRPPLGRDHRARYHADKRASFPPGIERKPGAQYRFRV